MKATVSRQSRIGGSTASVLPAVLAGSGGITIERSGNVTTIGFDLGSTELEAELEQAVTVAADAATDAAASATAAEEAATDAITAAASNYPTRTLAAASTIAGGTTWLRTQGYDSVGDYGGALYTSVVSDPGDGGFQSADGAWWTLATQDYTPEMFGAVADDATDNTAALKSLATFLNTKLNGFTVNCYPGGIYRIWPTEPASNDVIFRLDQGISGGTFNFQGAVFKTAATWAANIAYLFLLDSANSFLFNGLNFLSTHFMGLTSPTANYGPQIMFVESTFADSNNIALLDCVWQGARTGLAISRESQVTTRVRGVTLLNCRATNVFYPTTFEKNGDQFFCRGLYTSNCGRIYFPYNITQHDVEIIDDGQGVESPTCLIKCYTDDAETEHQNTTDQIKLKYSLQNTTGSMEFVSTVTLAFQQGTNVTTAGTIKNIEIDLDLDCPATVVQVSDAVTTLKSAFGGADDNTARGYTLSNIEIRGNLDANGENVRMLNLFTETDWTGENVGNILISDMRVEDQGNRSAIEIDGAALTSGGLALRNVYAIGSTGAAGQINIANQAADTVYVSNVRSTGGKLDDKTVLVADLPTAGVVGRKGFVSDANSTTFHAVAAGSGGNQVPVYDDGTNWRIG